jgi:hypothetical protein
MMRALAIALVLAALPACAPHKKHTVAVAPPVSRRAVPRRVEIFFRGEQPFARRGAEEWPIAGVTKKEMVFSPDGKRFAYVRDGKSHGSAPELKGEPVKHVLIRNIAGDPVNSFPVYRAGQPEVLTWIDNRRIGYLAPPEPGKPSTHRAFVAHDVQSGEILAARTGTGFAWNPEHRHVAFLVGAPGKQTLVVDGKNVYPREGATKFHGEFVWSPDGHGLAMVDVGGKAPKLVVLVEWDEAEGDLTWVVPPDALSPGLHVYWAGSSKVVIGESSLNPKFAAGWERVE